ncbi:hypothetical protein F5B22DRAFT_615858 [Xylaria bambusicola]|uniref:uncharacterized protein n=1 Tax=Xylaria bambusicola TaxID=326684 RepID=UPI00200802B3|nr:uncharacterized protein F5B22DRAFT_615858 [Xylaria bambusicola]KAI0509734.1 hypothetical protein F5B22DRAFT_615858 [Xylaria bambusicola]
MYNAKVLLALAALLNASLARTTSSPECTSLLDDIVARGPTVPPAILPYVLAQATGLPGDTGSFQDILSHPDVYFSQICGAAGQLPSSLLPEFAAWGSTILAYASTEIAEYDAAVTECVTTGAAAASITSYLHSIVSQPVGLCQPTGTVSVTAQPTATTSASGDGN